MKLRAFVCSILLLCLSVIRVEAQQRDEFSDLIELSLGYGFGFPPASGFWLDTGSGGITQGVITDDLIKRVFIQRELAERILLDLDYDSDRQGGFFAGDNVYSLQYRGLEGDFLQEISAGNRHLSIADTRMVMIDEGDPSSYALRARMGTDRLRIEGLLRYSQSESATRRFRGGGQLVEGEAPDVSYQKRRFFFLPDRGIEEQSLELYRSSDAAADRVIDGEDFALLVRGEDYRYDDSSGWIYLSRSVSEDEELAAYYRKGGVPVGHPSLGSAAFIDENGLRVDFDGTFTEYFDASSTYLYLAKEITRDDDGEILDSFNSYWEIKSGYALAEVYAGVLPADLEIELILTNTGERNGNYDALLSADEAYRIDPDSGVLFFTFNDGTGPAWEGFYPRSFPGVEPYDGDGDPNPFDPDHPIYGSNDDPQGEDSINSLEIRYTVDQDSFFLDFDIVEGSVQVVVDGRPLSPADYSVDYDLGTIEFAEGLIGPTSDIEVSYRYSPFLGGRQELFMGVGLDYELDWLQLRNLTTWSRPLQLSGAPQVGEERQSVLANSTDAAIVLGAEEGQTGWSGELKAGGALALVSENSKRLAVVADMEEAGLTVLSANVDTSTKGAEELGSEAFSATYPRIYEDLHGGESTDQTLVCTTTAALSSGEEAGLSRGFGYLADLSGYGQLRLYLFLPAAAPADAGFPLRLIGTAADGLELIVPATSMDTGWNEILVELEQPCRVLVNGVAVGSMILSGSDPLPRISEIRFGLLAGAGGIPSGYEFRLDEWHLADSGYSFDVAAYGEAKAAYHGELLWLGERLALLNDPVFSAGIQHSEGSLLEGPGRRRDNWFGAFRSRLLAYVPVSVELSRYEERDGSLFGASPTQLPPGLEDTDTGELYAHSIAVDAILPFLPSLAHSYQRSVSELQEVGLSAGGYIQESRLSVGESLAFSLAYHYPEGLEQIYRFGRSWLYDDPGLTVIQSHSGEISYAWRRNFASLELEREDSDTVENAALPDSLFGSYRRRLCGLFQPITASYPGADVFPQRHRDRGGLDLFLRREKVLGFSGGLDSEYTEQEFRPASGNRDLSVANSLDLAFPVSPRGSGDLVLTPSISRSFTGSYQDATTAVEELWLLGQSWKPLLMPPFHYLNPRLDAVSTSEREAVDLLAGSPEVLGTGAASLDTALALAMKLRDSPWYLPSRSNVEYAQSTGREGESYTQSWSVALESGTDFFVRSDDDADTASDRDVRLSLDTGWEGGWSYPYKVVTHSVFLESGLSLSGSIRGRLRADHNLTVSNKRQLAGGSPNQPDNTAISSLLGIEYSREREFASRRLKALAAAQLEPGSVGRIVHQNRIELENSFLLAASLQEIVDTTLAPVRLTFRHDTVVGVSEHLDLELSVKSIAGIEETISAGTRDYQPALGFELRLTAVLVF